MSESQEYKRRVTPKDDLPRLAQRLEKKLAPADEASAKGYDALEAAGEQLDEFTKALAGGFVEAELEVTDSLVHVLTTPVKKPGP